MDMYKGLVRQYDTGRIRGVILSGRPGIGKTASVLAFADGCTVVEIPMAQRLSEDFGSYAYPMVVDGHPKVMQLLSEASIEPLLAENIGDKPGVLLLDDVTAAESRLQSAILDLVQFGRIANRELGNNVVIFLTGNEPSDGSYATPWSKALLSRCHFISYEPDFDRWMGYSCNHELDPGVIAFLKQHPEAFAPVSDDQNWTDKNGCQPNPREWTALGIALTAYGGFDNFKPTPLFPDVNVWMESFIGTKGKNKFIAFMMEYGVYPTAEELIEQPVVWYNVPLQKRNHFAGALGTAFALRSWLLREASKTTSSKWDNLCKQLLPALEIIAEDHLELYSFFISSLIKLSAEQKLKWLLVNNSGLIP